MLLETTAAECKINFMDWMDNLNTSVASEDYKLYTLSGEREHGTFVNLSNKEFAKIVAKFIKLRIWASNIVANSYTCGAFSWTYWGKGEVSYQGMFIGPYQT